MSASEKLKELYLYGATFMVSKEGTIPTNALPQLLAVVEAAEYRRQDGTFDHVRVAAALAALEEMLT